MEGRLGKYDLLERLAIGGMAELFLARSSAQHGFEKTVVLKRILPSFAEQSDFVQMFLNEARLAAGLHHPNIAQVFDFGEDNGEFFFTMEYVAGRNLRQMISAARRASAPLPLGCALYIIENVAAGLHHAHEHRDADGRPLQIVHRDVSPSNVIVTYEGNVKLVDFGVAKIAALGPATLAGSIKGKVAYMSPEQCRGELVDRRSDIFSLGTLLWEITTGRKLFGADNGLALLKRVEEADVPKPTAMVPNYPRDLEQIVLKALSRDREGRFPTALDFRVAIEEFAYQHRVQLRSTRLASYMGKLFPSEDRSGSVIKPLPLVRGAVAPDPETKADPPPPAEPDPRAIPQPKPPERAPVAPRTASNTLVAPGPNQLRVGLSELDNGEDSREPKTLVADEPSEETSPSIAKDDRPEIVRTRRRDDGSPRWLIWFGVAVIGLGMTGGIVWRVVNEPDAPAQTASAAPETPAKAPEPEPEPEAVVEEPEVPPLPSDLESLRKLSYAERHSRLDASTGKVDVDLHVGLDLLQAADTENPCQTFADALSMIEANEDPQTFRWALDDAVVPEGDAKTCAGLEQRQAALLGSEEPSKSGKRRNGKRKRPRPEKPTPTKPEPEAAPPVEPDPPKPEPKPKSGVATKLDEDLRGMGD